MFDIHSERGEGVSLDKTSVKKRSREGAKDPKERRELRKRETKKEGSSSCLRRVASFQGEKRRREKARKKPSSID